MTIKISDAGILFNDQTTIGSANFQNKIINGGFQVNQRAVSGTVTLSAGVYGHDRWKAGASGCTYTFATSNNVTTITISAGTLQQVIEGLNLQSGAHYLSWTGTSQARVDSGAYGVSGLSGTAVGGTNQTVEFGVGTVTSVSYTKGAVSSFEQRDYGDVLRQCQRYGEPCPDIEFGSSGSATNVFGYRFNFQVPKRAAPTPSTAVTFGSSNGTASQISATTTSVRVIFTVTATAPFTFNNSNVPFFSCEL